MSRIIRRLRRRQTRIRIHIIRTTTDGNKTTDNIKSNEKKTTKKKMHNLKQ